MVHLTLKGLVVKTPNSNSLLTGAFTRGCCSAVLLQENKDYIDSIDFRKGGRTKPFIFLPLRDFEHNLSYKNTCDLNGLPKLSYPCDEKEKSNIYFFLLQLSESVF